MNGKIITILLLTGLVTFTLGWFFGDIKQFSEGIVKDVKQMNSLQKTNSKFVTIKQDQLDSLLIISSINNKTQSFATKLSGRFVMKESNCAGFNFISPTLVTWTNEIDCGHPDTLKIRWLNNTTFYTQDKVRLNKNCPPRVGIYQVVSFDGLNLTLKDIWTGWNDNTDETIEFVKR